VSFVVLGLLAAVFFVTFLALVVVRLQIFVVVELLLVLIFFFVVNVLEAL